ncbi:MAG: methyltransferase [Maritimibacter sp.]
MSTSRLSLALETGALTLPDGRVAVFGPPQGYDLSALDRETTQVICQFYPDHQAWAQAGYDVARVPEGEFTAALVVLPRAKDAARALISQAASTAPLVLIDGQKHDGVDSVLKAVKAKATPEGNIAKSHGKLFWITGGDFSDWAGQDRRFDGFLTRPGVFSADGPDKGSLALVDALPQLKGRVADLGAGWGYLSRHILSSDDVTHLDLIEADAVALDCARETISDPRAAFHWADATDFTPDQRYDVIVTNPPFHVSRAGDPGIGRAFIAAAASMLTPNGQLWLVANRHLPYEAEIGAHFHQVTDAGGTPGFKVIHASKPHRAK